MKKVITFSEYLILEQDGGGGVGFATPNAGGMGNVVAPTVGSVPGSTWGNGSGMKGSGDSSAYDTGKKFGMKVQKEKKQKKVKKTKKKTKEEAPRYFTKEYMRL
jgi:hypothetical protein